MEDERHARYAKPTLHCDAAKSCGIIFININASSPNAPRFIMKISSFDLFVIGLSLVASPLLAQTNTFPTSGSVGVGTLSPNYKLTVSGGQIAASRTGNLGGVTYDAADLVLGSNGETRNGYGGTNGSHIFLRSSAKCSITALDEGQDLGQISYQNGKWTFGEDVGWGAQTILVPGSLIVGGPANVWSNRLTIDTGGNLVHTAGTSDGTSTGGSHGRYVITNNVGYQFDNGTDSGGAIFRNDGGLWSGISGGGELRFLTGGTSPANSQGFNQYSASLRMMINQSGNVGIGTSNPTQKLSVNGTIRAKEVIVDTGWSDYVFDEGYRLAPLSEVERHIKAEKHLPGIPSAAEVAEHGVSMGDMQAKLLAKVEELTLHLIAQEKEIAALRHQVAAIKTSNR